MIDSISESSLGVEPHLSAAFALTSNPGAYALLLGAGVSISSGVPSAWGVQEELIRRLARAKGTDPEEPFAWYAKTYGKPPTYEDLLAALTTTQAERQALLREFFEPNAVEQEAGLKQPAPAHRAIARLVGGGLVRVILTINFDRLMEISLRDQGVEPTVVSSPADIDGLAPLHTQRCVVIHLHGDYLNPTAMLNTAEELGEYPPQVDGLLAKLLPDYGLICAGWSATWDKALRTAVSAHPTRFYATYWIDPFDLTTEAEDLRRLRRGTLVPATADEFFGALADACDAIRDTGRRHPLTAPVAAATAKRALAGAQVAISLHDTLQQEIQRLRHVDALTTAQFNASDVQAEHAARRAQLDAALEVPLTLIATCAYWGGPENDGWWFDEIMRFGVRPWVSGSTALIDQRQFPATAILYAGGIAAVAARRYPLTVRLLTEPTTTDHNGQRVPVASHLDPRSTLNFARAHLYVHDLLKPIFEDYVGLGDAAYVAASERFEYLRLVQTTYDQLKAEARECEAVTDEAKLRDLETDTEDTAVSEEAKRKRAEDILDHNSAARQRRLERQNRAAVGLPHIFVTGYTDNHRATTAAQLDAEITREADQHPLLRAGLCGGNLNALRTAMQAVDDAIDEVANEAAWSLGSGWIPSEFYPDETGKWAKATPP